MFYAERFDNKFSNYFTREECASKLDMRPTGSFYRLLKKHSTKKLYQYRTDKKGNMRRFRVFTVQTLLSLKNFKYQNCVPTQKE